MSPRLRAALYAQAGAVFSLHPCLYAGDRSTAGRSRFATLLPGDAAVSPSNGDHAGTQRADPPPPRNGPKHRGAGRSRSATGPPRQSRSTRQFFCAEVLVAFRALQGIAGAGLIPLSQATLLQINPPERHGHAMAVFGVGTICGPIMGPALGGWLTQEYSWRWVFYINLPIGLLCTTGVLVFIRHNRNIHREPFDVVGFLALSLGIGALQLLLDRGELKDWFNSSEIWIEATIAGLGLYLLSVHTVTTDGPSFLNRDLLRSTNFTAGTVLMFAG